MPIIIDEEILQRVPGPDYTAAMPELVFSTRDLAPIFYLELAPTLASHPRIERDGWGVDDAPEPGTEAFREAAAEVGIPREERVADFGRWHTAALAGFVAKSYGTLYSTAREADWPVGTYELWHAHRSILTAPDRVAEALGYLAELDGVSPPEARDEYRLSPLVEHEERYERVFEADINAADDEVRWLREAAEEQPAVWAYVEPDTEATVEETTAA